MSYLIKDVAIVVGLAAGAYTVNQWYAFCTRLSLLARISYWSYCMNSFPHVGPYLAWFKVACAACRVLYLSHKPALVQIFIFESNSLALSIWSQSRFRCMTKRGLTAWQQCMAYCIRPLIMQKLLWKAIGSKKGHKLLQQDAVIGWIRFTESLLDQMNSSATSLRQFKCLN